jgi:hypothetical protein
VNANICLFIVICLAALSPPRLAASTFVGNGGNAGDVEMAVTLQQLREIFQLMASEQAPTCKCPESLEGRSICEPLRYLSEHESRFCSELSHAKAKDIVQTLGDANLRVKWTHDPIEIIEDGKRRAADAVARPETGEITVNLSRFLEMKPYERIFLLSHELVHFTQYNDRPIVDSGPIGEFSGDEGGRRFVNAMASSATVIATSHAPILKKYRARLQRAQGWRRGWVDAALGATLHTAAEESAYSMKSIFGGQVNARYYITHHFGPIVSYRGNQQAKNIRARIQAKESVSAIGAGLTYRYFPFDNPLSYLGQSHLAVSLMAENITAQYDVSDEYTALSERVSVWGANVGVDYYLPIYFNIWTTAGLNYLVNSYHYSEFDFKYGNQLYAHVGVSYAF